MTLFRGAIYAENILNNIIKLTLTDKTNWIVYVIQIDRYVTRKVILNVFDAERLNSRTEVFANEARLQLGFYLLCNLYLI